MDPVILGSARKHQVSDGDMLRSYRNSIRVFDLGDLAMLIVPDAAARLLEVGVSEAEGFVVHARPARDKFLET